MRKAVGYQPMAFGSQVDRPGKAKTNACARICAASACFVVSCVAPVGQRGSAKASVSPSGGSMAKTLSVIDTDE